MEPIQTEWEYPTTQVTLDKHGARTAVSAPACAELIGADLQFDGGIRPFPGFHLYHDFALQVSVGGSVHPLGATVALLSGATNIGTARDSGIGEQITWFKPIQFRVGVNRYGFGYVYLVMYLSGPVVHWAVRADLWYCGTGENLPQTFSRIELTNGTGDIPALVDTSTWGPFIFVFVQGQSPILINFLEAGGVQVITQCGPGEHPVLFDVHNDPGAGTLPAPDATTPGQGRVFLNGGDTGTGERSLMAGAYSFAYRLFDSRTGRWSSLSEVGTIRRFEFTGGLSEDWVGVELRVDNTRFDTIYMYRSVRIEDSGTVLYGASILLLDQIVESVADNGTHNYFYKLEDTALLQQEPFVDYTTFDAEMPEGGAGTIHEGTCVLGTSSAQTRNTAGTAEIRWSSPYELSPELFSPDSKYTPPTPTDGVLKFVPVANNVIGFSKTRQYMMNRRPGTFQVNEMNKGYGIVSPYSADVMGNQVYIVCDSGVKVVDLGGNVSAISALDHLVQTEWAGITSSISVAYDSVMNVLFIHNPLAGYDTDAGVGGRAAVLWFNSGHVSELYDMNFLMCQSGASAMGTVFDGLTFSTPTGIYALGYYSRQLVDRAHFLTPGGQILLVDNNRVGNGYVFFPTIGFSMHTRGVITAKPAGGITIGSGEGSTSWVSSTGLTYGFKVYVLDGARPGWSKWVTASSGSTFTLGGGNTGFSIGDVVGISPAFVKWTGYMVALAEQESYGQSVQVGGHDHFRMRHVETAACAFTDVKLDNSTVVIGTSPKFYAGVYQGNAASEVSYVYPKSRTGAAAASVLEGPSVMPAAFHDTAQTYFTTKLGVDISVPFPSITIHCPGLDFRMLGVKITGRLLASDRYHRAT